MHCFYSISTPPRFYRKTDKNRHVLFFSWEGETRELSSVSPVSSWSAQIPVLLMSNPTPCQLTQPHFTRSRGCSWALWWKNAWKASSGQQWQGLLAVRFIWLGVTRERRGSDGINNLKLWAKQEVWWGSCTLPELAVKSPLTSRDRKQRKGGRVQEVRVRPQHSSLSQWPVGGFKFPFYGYSKQLKMQLEN